MAVTRENSGGRSDVWENFKCRGIRQSDSFPSAGIGADSGSGGRDAAIQLDCFEVFKSMKYRGICGDFVGSFGQRSKRRLGIVVVEEN